MVRLFGDSSDDLEVGGAHSECSTAAPTVAPRTRSVGVAAPAVAFRVGVAAPAEVPRTREDSGRKSGCAHRSASRRLGYWPRPP